jgi:DUF4097 and DUF4098 domain-containing protein YvlB
MMKSRLALSLALLAVLATLPAVACAVDYRTTEGKFDRALKVTGDVDLTVTTGSGSIDVRTGDASSVRVSAIIRAHSDFRRSEKETEELVRRIEANPPIEQNANVIRIGRFADAEMRRNISISYTLVVPATTKLNSSTGSGSQSVDAIRGPVDASTGSGSITLVSIGAEARANTGSGSITLSTVKGAVRASTGSGSIFGTGIGGTASASTGSGNVELEQTAPGDVDVHTDSGSVRVRGVKGGLTVRTGSGTIVAQGEPTAAWRLHTSSGSITVRLPANAAFDLAARTSSGSVRSDHPVTLSGTISRREMRGKVRGGGVFIDVSTSSGSIRIE